MARVGILIPAHNAAETIAETLDSILRQSFRDYDVTIVDDGSTDSTLRVVEGYIGRVGANPIKIISRENQGIIRTRNELLASSLGNHEFVSWCDADDIFMPRKLELQVEVLARRPLWVGLGSWFRSFGSRRHTVRKPTSPEGVRHMALLANPFGFSTTLFRCNTLCSNSIRFDERLVSAEDFRFIAECLRYGEMANIPSVLALYRTHPNQESTKNRKRQFDQHLRIVWDGLNSVCPGFWSVKEIPVLVAPRLKDPETLAVRTKYARFIGEETNLEKRMAIAAFDFTAIARNKHDLVGCAHYALRYGPRIPELLRMYGTKW